jgi:hypothetical protein
MDTSLRSRLSQIWFAVQNVLFPEIEAQLGQALTPKLEQLIRILELARVEEHVASSWGAVGRPPHDRVALARTFVAKAVLDLPTTEALIGVTRGQSNHSSCVTDDLNWCACLAALV